MEITETSSLKSLPTEILEEITNLIDGQDCALLFGCGDFALNRRLGSAGGVKYFKATSCTLFRFQLPAALYKCTALRTFICTASSNVNYRQIKLSKLPPTLTRLEIFCLGAYNCLWDLHNSDPMNPKPLNLKAMFPSLQHLRVGTAFSDVLANLLPVLPSTLLTFNASDGLGPHHIALIPRSVTDLNLRVYEKDPSDNHMDKIDFPPFLASLTVQFRTESGARKAMPNLPSTVTMLEVWLHDSSYLPPDLFAVLPPNMVTLHANVDQPTEAFFKALPRSITDLAIYTPEQCPSSIIPHLPPNLRTMDISIDITMPPPPPPLLPTTTPPDTESDEDAPFKDAIRQRILALPRSLVDIESSLEGIGDPYEFMKELPRNIEYLGLIAHRNTLGLGFDGKAIPPGVTSLTLRRMPFEYLHGSIPDYNIFVPLRALNSLSIGNQSTALFNSALIRDLARGCPLLTLLNFKLSGYNDPPIGVTIESTPEILRHLPQNLTELRIDFSERPFERLPDLPHLRKLDVTKWNGTETLDDHWTCLPKTLVNFTSKCSAGFFSPAAFSVLMERCARLHSLSINGISPDIADEHLVSMQQLKRIVGVALDLDTTQYRSSLTWNIVHQLPSTLVTLGLPALQNPLAANPAQILERLPHLNYLFLDDATPNWFKEHLRRLNPEPRL